MCILISIDFNQVLIYNEIQSYCCSCAPDVNDKWIEIYHMYARSEAGIGATNLEIRQVPLASRIIRILLPAVFLIYTSIRLSPSKATLV